MSSLISYPVRLKEVGVALRARAKCEPAKVEKAEPAPETRGKLSNTVEAEIQQDRKKGTPLLPRTSILAGMILGGLWRKRGDDGKVYLSGKLSDAVEIRIVANSERAGDDDPSHLMYMVPTEPPLKPMA